MADLPHPPSPPLLRASFYGYDLPPRHIAQTPSSTRESARLLVIPRAQSGPQAFQDLEIPDLPSLLRAGDLLVLNDTRVTPARLFGRREATGGHAEVLVLEWEGNQAKILLKTRGSPRPGERIVFQSDSGLKFTLKKDMGSGLYETTYPGDSDNLLAMLEEHGRIPLPPYIRRGETRDPRDQEDRDRYQTVFARHPGAAAAPTAGLHLTDDLLKTIRSGGVEIATVTLHVGLGTFQPVHGEDIRRHTMHEEAFTLPEETASAYARCRERGGRIIAVGTTVVRVLESCLSESRHLQVGSGRTTLFLHPPEEIRSIDGLLTNFHAPDSTLVMLVAAFAGTERIRGAYRFALRSGYRFLSYGDATFII